MKMSLCATLAAAGIALAACSPAQLAQVQGEAYQLTVVDGAGYIRENHEWRKQLRAKNKEIVLAVIDACVAEARKQEFIDKQEQAMATVAWCQNYIKRNYPDLVTIEALREGKALVNEFGNSDETEASNAPTQ